MKRLAALLLAALLSACATQAPIPPAVPAPDVPADAPAVYSLDIQVENDTRDNRLAKLLGQHLDIARYRASQAALSRVDLARLSGAPGAHVGHFTPDALDSRIHSRLELAEHAFQVVEIHVAP